VVGFRYSKNNTYRFDSGRYISPKGRVGDFLNHSCYPNAKVTKRGEQLFIVAIASIKKDREVCIDYSTITASDDVWEMECNCGSRRCRGMVRMFKKLPRQLRELYIRMSIVPSYIIDL
jgi:SET domain-containing protein